MTRWEYYVQSDLSSEQLSDLGLQGWELVTVAAYGGPIMPYKLFYFKRPHMPRWNDA